MDPDYFEEAASVASRSSGGTSFLLRSACRHQGPCHEGHGLEFHSRISPSPARSYHKRRRARRKSWGTTLESSPEDDDQRPTITTSVRRDLSEDLAKVERTSGWVANLKRMDVDHQKVKLTTTMESVEQRVTFQRIIQTPVKLPDWNRSVSGGSPRLLAFDGEAWKRSPRTGYTYVDSATYRQTWTPDREIPMPHMARRPLDEYNDGEVSFFHPLDFSSDEEDDLEKSSNESVFSFFMMLIMCSSSLWKGSKSMYYKLEVLFKLVAKQTILMSSQLLLTLEMMLPFLMPYQMPNSGNDFPEAEDIAKEEEEGIEETYIKRITRFYHDIYNWIPTRKAMFLIDLYVKSVRSVMAVMAKAPKALLFLLIPSIFTNLVAEAQTVPNLAPQKGPVHKMVIWTKTHVPDVRQAINSTIQVITGLILSLVLFFHPKNLWSLLPKVSRKRVRRWRSRGPPTRYVES